MRRIAIPGTAGPHPRSGAWLPAGALEAAVTVLPGLPGLAIRRILVFPISPISSISRVIEVRVRVRRISLIARRGGMAGRQGVQPAGKAARLGPLPVRGGGAGIRARPALAG